MPRSVKAIRRIRTAVFVFAVSGLTLASLCASRREPTLVRIGECSPVLNFSTVRVQGMLESRPRVLRDGSALYLIADGTGSLPVFLSQAPEGDLPRAGTPVAATGVLSMGAGRQMSMRVQDPENIERLPRAAPLVIYGRVAEVQVPPEDSRSPYRIILDRSEGRMEVVHWFVPKHQVAVGERVMVKGSLGHYQGRMQLKVREGGDIRLHPEE